MTTTEFKIQVFKHPQFGEIRVTGTSEEPLFCLVDICKALEIKNASMAKRKLKSGGVKIIEGTTFAQKNQYDETDMERQAFFTFISEQNLYRLIMRSTKPQAEPFQDWVCGEVLPSIRKHGGYIITHEGDTDEDIRRRAEEVLKATLEQKDKLIAEQDERIRSLDRQVGEQQVRIQKSAEEILDLEHDIDRFLPKALYADNVLDSISCYTTTQIAKELGMTAQELNRLLCAEHIQYYQSGQYMLYAEYAHRGLAKSRTHFDLFVGQDTVHTRMYLVWTERGRKFIHQLKVKG